MKKARLSNFELLRIIAMFLIVLAHLCGHGILNDRTISIDFYNEYKSVINLALFFTSWGRVSVNIFILLTGFFMINTNISFAKILKLWFSIFLYSIFGLFINIYLSKGNIDLLLSIKSFFPVVFNQYWFMTSYILLYLSIPILNHLWTSASDRLKLYIIILLFVSTIIIPTLFTERIFSEVALFILLYYLGAVIKERDFCDKKHINLGINIFIISFLIYFTSFIVLQFIGISTSKTIFLNNSTYFSNGNSPLTLFMAIGLLILFGNISIKQNKFINKISSAAFAVYLIHDNNSIRTILWHHILHVDDFMGRKFIIALISIILYALLIYIVATFIEWIRSFLFDSIEIKLIEQLLTRISDIKFIRKFKENKFYTKHSN